MTKIAVLGIDLGKNVCSLVGFDEVEDPMQRQFRHPAPAAGAQMR